MTIRRRTWTMSNRIRTWPSAARFSTKALAIRDILCKRSCRIGFFVGTSKTFSIIFYGSSEKVESRCKITTYCFDGDEVFFDSLQGRSETLHSKGQRVTSQSNIDIMLFRHSQKVAPICRTISSSANVDSLRDAPLPITRNR